MVDSDLDSSDREATTELDTLIIADFEDRMVDEKKRSRKHTSEKKIARVDKGSIDNEEMKKKRSLTAVKDKTNLKRALATVKDIEGGEVIISKRGKKSAKKAITTHLDIEGGGGGGVTISRRNKNVPKDAKPAFSAIIEGCELAADRMESALRTPFNPDISTYTHTSQPTRNAAISSYMGTNDIDTDIAEILHVSRAVTPGAYSLSFYNSNSDSSTDSSDEDQSIDGEEDDYFSELSSRPDFPSPSSRIGSNLVCAVVVNENDMEETFRQRFIRDSIRDSVLAVAEALPNDEIEQQIKKNMEKSSQQEKKLGIVLFFLSCFVVAVGLVVVLVIFYHNRNQDAVQTIEDIDTIVEPMGIDHLRYMFRSISWNTSLYDKSSPQYKAMHWLVYNDTAEWSSREKYSASWLSVYNRKDENLSINIDTNTIIERYVMAVLYYSTGGANWENGLRFLSPHSVCEWRNIENPPDEDEIIKQGKNEIKCNKNGRVDSIVILKNHLSGTLPRELVALRYLERISFGRDNLYGTIPMEWGKIENLEYLQLYEMSLNGTIPESFSRLRRLRQISVCNNNFSGKLPQFEEWPKIERIDFGANNFVGTLPEFPIQSKVALIDLGDNELTGPLPVTLFSQPQLKDLLLMDNKLSSTIGQNIQGLGKLENLYINNNKFTGSLPTHLMSLFDLEILIINDNQFSGSISSAIGNMRRLSRADLSNNKFTGSLPIDLGRLNSLQKLSIASNEGITGTLPASIGLLGGGMGNLKTLSLESTGITGGIEESFCNSNVLFTEITADCGTRTAVARGEPKVECSCCKSCCSSGSHTISKVSSSETAEIGGENEDHLSVCTLDMNVACRINAESFQTDKDRDALCSCSEDGTMVRCSDVQCKSCSQNGNFCASNIDYGYDLDANSGEVLSFHSTMQYYNTYNNTEAEDAIIDNSDSSKRGSLNITFSTDPGDKFLCHVSVDGQKCQMCTSTECNSGFLGLEIDCTNIIVDGYGQKGYNFHSCSPDAIDVGFLEIFQLYDRSELVGCPLMLQFG